MSPSLLGPCYFFLVWPRSRAPKQFYLYCQKSLSGSESHVKIEGLFSNCVVIEVFWKNFQRSKNSCVCQDIYFAICLSFWFFGFTLFWNILQNKVLTYFCNDLLFYLPARVMMRSKLILQKKTGFCLSCFGICIVECW